MIIIVRIKKSRTQGKSYTLSTLWLLSFFLLFYFIRRPDLASLSVKSALDVCAAGLIPSLFPFMVLVSIINSSGLAEKISGAIGYPLGYILGTSAAAAPAILLGALGGFPIGAVCTRGLYESGAITKSEAERLIGFTNNASPAFCIGTVGAALLGDTSLGVKLYTAQISAALTVALLTRKKMCGVKNAAHTVQKINISESITSAVTGSAVTMLNICAFAVFFAVVGDALCCILSHRLGNIASGIGAVLCELTLGARTCASLGGTTGILMCAFALGWSGISVHLQIASVLSGSGLSMKKYFICKFFQGILSAFIMSVLIRCF